MPESRSSAAADRGRPWSRRSFTTLSPFNNPNLLLTQAIQLIDQPIDLPIRGGDLGSEHALLVRRARSLALPVQRQHLLHQPHHLVVAGDVGAVAEIDGAEGLSR